MQHLKTFIFLFLGGTILFYSFTGNGKPRGDKDSFSKAPESFSSGDDMYYELTTNSTGKNFSMQGVTKILISSKGDMRNEINMTNSFSGNKHSSTIVVIGHSDKPDESISIDDEEKTYTINHIDRDNQNTGEKIQSAVSKIGEEKIVGFNCVHARIISKRSIGNISSNVDTIDIWKSDEVPVPASVKKLMDQFESKTGIFMSDPEVAKKLKQMGCQGFIVKIEMKGKSASTITELTKVEHRSIPASKFQIPAGYTEDKN
jgi:hypothetical protein